MTTIEELMEHYKAIQADGGVKVASAEGLMTNSPEMANTIALLAVASRIEAAAHLIFSAWVMSEEG